MDAAIRWSYDLLEPAERRLFGRLSVFAGSFTLEAVELVCGDSQPSPTSTLTELRQLFTRSLVITEPQRDGSVRYRVLEPLREFGLRLLCESGEEPALRGRHAAFCLELARRSNLVLLRSAGGPWLGTRPKSRRKPQNAAGPRS